MDGIRVEGGRLCVILLFWGVMFALLAHSALRLIPPAIPPATDTPQEKGLYFQSVVVFTSIDPVTAQLSPCTHTHT